MKRDSDSVQPIEFLETAFEPNDWLAVFVKDHRTGRVAQRVAPKETIAAATFQDWLFRENRSGASVYVSVNALRPRTATRRRSAVGAVRHLFLDADSDLEAVLASILDRADLPEPSFVLHTSGNRGHVLWRVTDFAVRDAELLERYLARELGTDPAATVCSQLTRLPGYLNHKHSPPYLVKVNYVGVSGPSTPADFPRPTINRDDRGVGNRERHLNASANVVERARRYLAAVPPAISGQHGDVHTFRVCCRLARGFALDDADALRVLAAWNAACRPPWPERELVDKLRRARRYGREAIGGLLGDQV